MSALPILMPSPSDRGVCRCSHSAAQHWLGEPGGCEGAGGCDCLTYRPAATS